MGLPELVERLTLLMCFDCLLWFVRTTGVSDRMTSAFNIRRYRRSTAELAVRCILQRRLPCEPQRSSGTLSASGDYLRTSCEENSAKAQSPRAIAESTTTTLYTQPCHTARLHQLGTRVFSRSNHGMESHQNGLYAYTYLMWKAICCRRVMSMHHGMIIASLRQIRVGSTGLSLVHQ